MGVIQINTVFNIALEFEAAAFHKRLFAYMIDFFLLIVYLLGIKYFLYAGLDISMQENMGLDILLISLPMLLYSLITEVLMNGQTIGKKLMAIRVISLDGGEPTLGQYLLRWITKFYEWPFLFGYILFSAGALFAYIFATGFLGLAVIITIAVTAKNQRLGDIAAGTVLVATKTNFTVNDTVFVDIDNNNYQVTFPAVMRLSDNDINTIKSVVTLDKKRNNHDTSTRVEYKIKDVLKIQSSLSSIDFLEKLLEDYNYLATKE